MLSSRAVCSTDFALSKIINNLNKEKLEPEVEPPILGLWILEGAEAPRSGTTNWMWLCIYTHTLSRFQFLWLPCELSLIHSCI